MLFGVPQVWLLDCNVWRGTTDSLLYDWDALSLDSSHEEQNENEAPPAGDAPLLQSPLPPPSPPEAAPRAEVELRLVEDAGSVRAGRFANYRAPFEMHAFSQSLQGSDGQNSGSSRGGPTLPEGRGPDGGPFDFQSFMEQCMREAAEGTSSDSDGEA